MRRYFSSFKNPEADTERFFAWSKALMRDCGMQFEAHWLESLLGRTLIWKGGNSDPDAPALLIFPGYRTSPLFWQLGGGLAPLAASCRLFLVETNGQPNPSEGHTPAIRSDGYGRWAVDLLDKLELSSCFVAGASFGGNVGVKLGLAAPSRVKKLFLLNPGCLQNFSLHPKNLYLNLRPLLTPSRAAITAFLQQGVFHAPQHQLSERAFELALDYQELALTRYRDRAQKPYFMRDELQKLDVPVHLFLGTKDLIFPYARSLAHAKRYLAKLEVAELCENIGHGIETDAQVLSQLAEAISSHRQP